MINRCSLFVLLWLTSSILSEAVNPCSVEPTSAVVVVGERVYLNCTATGDNIISSWQIGLDVKNKTVVYKAATYGANITVTTQEYVGDGYSVSSVADNNTLLQISKANFSQAGAYVCQCDDLSKSTALIEVVVLASEPKFSVTSSVINGNQVSLSCNISFNGSGTISSNLEIKDISGRSFNRTVCSPNSVLTFCNVKYTTTANATVDQSFTCSVLLISNNNTIFSRTANTSLEWKVVSSAEIFLPNSGKCSVKKCVVGQSITCNTNGDQRTTSIQWWQIQRNGSNLPIGNGSQHLVLNRVGQFTFQCRAYSTIHVRGRPYNVASNTSTINVTDSYDDNGDDKTPMPLLTVIGISVAIVAIGVIVVVIVVVVACICCSRRQNKQTFQAIEPEYSSIPERPPPANRYDDNNPKKSAQRGNAHTDPNHSAASNNNKTSIGTEVTVFDNFLYEGARSASPDLAVTGAGSVPEECIYNEIRTFD